MLDGSLFTRDFLAEGIMQEADWKHLSDAAAKAMAGKIEALLTRFPHSKKPNESQTEDDVVWPILAALGWSDHLRQQNLSARGRDDVPDGLLFPDADAKARANHDYEEWRRYEHGRAIVESKRWNRLLDRPDRGKEDKGVPSTQIIRYLRRVDDLTTGKLRWGILTNGRIWRLYYQGARSVSEDFLELDLASILGIALTPICSRPRTKPNACIGSRFLRSCSGATHSCRGPRTRAHSIFAHWSKVIFGKKKSLATFPNWFSSGSFPILREASPEMTPTRRRSCPPNIWRKFGTAR
jgi:hypothetical protein